MFNNAVAVEMYNLSETNFLPYSLWTLTTANAEALRTTVNYKMIVGDEDFTETSNERFRDHLISLGIDPQYEVVPGVEHLGGQYVEDGTGLRFLSDHFASVFRREGDYDRDGDTDAADFTAWRKAFGAALPNADGNQDGTVDGADYVLWRKLSEAAAGLGGETLSTSIPFAAAPEPASLALAIFNVFAASVARCKPRLY
jgi:hypothetical protein